MAFSRPGDGSTTLCFGSTCIWLVDNGSSSLYSKGLQGSQKSGEGFLGFAPVFRVDSENGYILANHGSAFDVSFGDSAVRSITLDGERFNALLHSEKEANEIVDLFGKRGRCALGYFHTEATEENFKSKVKDYRYVHIATHGIINEDRPQLSGVIFSQPIDSTYTEDGILYSGETYNLDLNVDLVVLSSCESGIGKLVRGEGLMAFNKRVLIFWGLQHYCFPLESTRVN